MLLTVLLSKVMQQITKLGNTIQWQSIVHANPNTANGSVSLYSHHAFLFAKC